MSLQVHIKRFDDSLELPQYQTQGAAALDLAARVETQIEPGTVGMVPLNIALQLPKGYWALLAARSSLHKTGLMLANGIGIGDYDFRGDGDEYHAPLFNVSKKTVIVARGQRIVQLLILQREVVDLVEVKNFADTPNRGGFGSTGS